MTETVRVRAPEATAVLLRGLFERAGDDRVEVVRLTDEEVTVLDGTSADHVAPTPWLSGLPDDQQETARTVAARGLAVRGLARPSAVDDASGDLVVGVQGDVYAALAARRSASAVVICERRGGEGSITYVMYLQDDRGVVDEIVNSSGLHVFSAGPQARAVDALVAFLDPGGAAGVDGPAVTVELDPTAPVGLPALPAEGVVLAGVVVAVGSTSGGDPVERRLSVLTSAHEVRTARADPNRPAVLVQPVGPESLRKQVEALLAPVAEPA